MTNQELAKIGVDIYNNLKTVYAKGGIGWKLTQTRMNALIKQYPDNKKYLKQSDLGKYACDCSGMVVGMAYDGWTVTTQPVWSRAHDWNDASLGEKITNCVAPADAIPGMCLWKKGHVGLAIGNGYALDSNAEASGSGIHLRKISDIKWEKAGMLPEIEYVDTKVGDIILMTVTKIEDGIAYGEARVSNPDTIQVGSRVTIDKGAKAGGLNPDYRGKTIDSRYANNKYIDTVVKIEKHYGEDEALLKGINTWVAFKYLNLVE